MNASGTSAFETKILSLIYTGIFLPESLSNASPHRHLGMSCVTVSRFKPPFVPRTVFGSNKRSLIIRTLLVTTAPREATLTPPNPATAFFLKARHLFFLTASASVSHICGRCFCIVLGSPYSSAFLKSGRDCLVARGLRAVLL